MTTKVSQGEESDLLQSDSPVCMGGSLGCPLGAAAAVIGVKRSQKAEFGE